MIKYIILGDTHFGKYKGNPEFLKNQMDFFEYQLVPFMVKHNITQIFQLGDFFDNRKTLDGVIYYSMLTLGELFKSHNIKVTFPMGNHDSYYRESLHVHLTDILRKVFPEVFTIIEKEEFFTLNNKKVAFVPWLTEGSKVSEKAKSSDIIIGHFEFKNFEVVKGIESKHGLENDIFGGARVYSGHYHNVQKKENILYCGTPYQMDWSDFKERKGFWVTDFNSEDEFYDNKISFKHIKIIFDDRNENFISIHGLVEKELSIDLESFLGTAESFLQHKLKFIINYSETGDHIKCIQYLKSFENFEFDIINNYQVSKLINADIASTFTESSEVPEEFDDTNGLIYNVCKENNIVHVLEEVIKIKNEGATC